ncbi:MAG: hypothetical protein ABI787_03065 [Spartobacteria bacterium]
MFARSYRILWNRASATARDDRARLFYQTRAEVEAIAGRDGLKKS